MSYLLQNPGEIAFLLGQHLAVTAIALLIATPIALGLGTLIVRHGRLYTPFMGLFDMLYTIPSIALLILLLPILGLGAPSVIAALTIYSQIILVRNVVAGLRTVDPATLEAAQGLGMNGWQRWWVVELPLALPVILAGVRLATLVNIAIGTVGAMVGAGGLGRLLFDGVAEERYDKILAGAIVVSALSLGLNALLQMLERAVTLQGRIARAERRGRVL